MKKTPQRIKAKSMAVTSAKPDPGNRKVRAIIGAARKLFIEQGLADPSMDLITDTAGVSKATIYVYFPSKEDLLLALIEHEVRSNERRVIWEPGAEPTEPEEDLRGIAKRLMTLFLDLRFRDRAFHRLIEDQVATFPKIGRAVFAAGPQALIAQMSSYLSMAKARGLLDIPDVQLAATQFISLVRSDLHLRRKFLVPLPAKKELDAIVEGSVQVFLAAYGRVNQGGRR